MKDLSFLSALNCTLIQTFPVLFLQNRRTLLLLVLWYSFFMLAAVIYYSRVRWKEDSHLIRVYNSLFVYPSAVPVTRQTLKPGLQRPPSLLHSKHFDRKLPEYLLEDIEWQPFDVQTGNYRYRYDSRYAQDNKRTRESPSWLGNVTVGGRTIYDDVFVPDGFAGNLSDYLAAMKLYQETIEKVIKARTNPESPGSTPLTLPDRQQLEQIELGRKLVLSQQQGLMSDNSSAALLAAIESNMQQIRKETEASLQRLADLTSILNSPNGSVPKDAALLGQLRLNATQLHNQLLLGGNNLTNNASLQYMLAGLNNPSANGNSNREQNVNNMQMRPAVAGTLRGGNVQPMQKVEKPLPKDQSKTAPDRPGLWGYLTGGGPVLKDTDTESKTKADKLTFSATRKAAETAKFEQDPDIIRRPPTQMPEVDGYYLLETRRVSCEIWMWP